MKMLVAALFALSAFASTATLAEARDHRHYYHHDYHHHYHHNYHHYHHHYGHG